MSFFRPLTLRQGLILVVFAALLPVVVVSVVQGFATLENTRNLAISRLNANASAVAERERDPFVIAQHLLTTLAANPDVVDMSEGCGVAVAGALRDYRPLVNFARADADGIVQCSVIPYSPGLSLANERWWQRSIKADRLTITNSPIFGRITKRKILVMVLPIRARNGQQMGTLNTGIDVSYLQDALKAAPEGKSGALAIVTADGEIVAHGRQQLAFKPDITGRPDSDLVAETSDGTEWMYIYHKLYSSDLFVLYAEPREQLMATALSQVRASILLPLVSILLASLAIWLGTHRLVVIWLRDLRKVADKFANGDFTGDREKFEKAPEEIAELSADLHSMAEVINKRNSDLTQAMEAKTLLTREVHHRVKNNLQIITSLLTLQAARVRDGGAKNVLAQTRARISALALIHRLLYEQDNNNERGEVSIDNLMGELCGQLRSANRPTTNVELKCQTCNQPVPVDHAVPLALFVVEAVTNAYRHAFAVGSNGLITLGFDIDGDDAALTISDNGKGYAVGTEAGQMGTELMQAFATQVNGQLNISSTIGGGTRVVLRFPLGTKPLG